MLLSLKQHKRIVAKIEALQTRRNLVKEQLQPIKLLLDQFRQSVLAPAFRGDLTKDWCEQNTNVEPASKLITSNYKASNKLPISWCEALVKDVVENLKY
ncbi:restriction modification system DNA specificity subunit [Chondrocystis sp. NIES-4102]|nr:restriction modification system DNA specificity subunit [Chondrocystis sp. NIES-4102]